jgi:hypothetical protein
VLNATYWVVVVLLLGSIIELLRRKFLREKYAIVWLAMAVSLLAAAIFPENVNKLSSLLGFQYLSNFVLFFLSIINLFIAMQLSLSIGKSENQIQTLAEELALLKSKFDK